MVRNIFAVLFLLSVVLLSNAESEYELIQDNYVWVHVMKVDCGSGNIVKEIRGKVIEKYSEIKKVDKLEKFHVLHIQRHPDGKWFLPANIFYTKNELAENTVYKMVFEFSTEPPNGNLTVYSSGI